MGVGLRDCALYWPLLAPTVRSQDLPPPIPPLPPPAPASVEQLAARLQAMEELNKKLVEQLEKTNRDHDEQMRQVLERVGDLSRRLNGAPTA